MNNRNTFNIGILLVTLLSLGSGTVAAAQLAVPGDNLYTIKTVSEDVRLALAIPEKTKIAVHYQITERKIKEVETLRQRQGKTKDIEVAIEKIAKHSEKLSAYVKNNESSQADKMKQNIIKQQNKLEKLQVKTAQPKKVKDEHDKKESSKVDKVID